ncbi:uncharacterized protein [Canis lupus baileyi]|uniref:uncharacterized protein n=1 Tax=Canis lupus baileyi TaxID=143281 RepID=UPI003B973DC5
MRAAAPRARGRLEARSSWAKRRRRGSRERVRESRRPAERWLRGSHLLRTSAGCAPRRASAPPSAAAPPSPRVRACVRAAGSPARLASVGSEPEAPRESRAAAGRVRPGRGGGRGRLAVTPPQALAVAPFSSPPPLLRSLSGLRHLCAVGPGGLRRPLSGSGVAFQCGMKFAGVSPKDLNLYLELIKILSSGKCPQSSCQWLRDD